MNSENATQESNNHTSQSARASNQPQQGADDSDFFQKLTKFLEDAPAEAILRDANILKHIQDGLLSIETSQNLQSLSVLRIWCRKLAVRLNMENDNRIVNKNNVKNPDKLRSIVAPYCLALADLCTQIFSKPELLPFACLTVRELLNVSKSAPNPQIIETVVSYTHIKNLRIPLLEIVALSSFPIPGLPILDPEIAILHPDLHKKLIEISPEGNKNDVQLVLNYVSKIQAMNNNSIPFDRNLLPFCDFDKVFDNIPKDVLASHPDDEVRSAFYKKALENNYDVSQFVDSLITAGIFDKVVQKEASQILVQNLDSIIQAGLTPKQLACLQCLPVKSGSTIFKGISDAIDSSDEFNLICGWVRYLFSKDDWVRDQAISALTKLVGFEINFGIEDLGMKDSQAKQLIDQLKLPGNLSDFQEEGQIFVDIIYNKDQIDAARNVAAMKIAKKILDPYCNVRKLLPQLHQLPFAKFPLLLHAVAIRDGSLKIDTRERLIELMKAINTSNVSDLLPILARAVFQPLLYIEVDGSNLLRIPRYSQAEFQVPGCNGYYDPEFYKPIDRFPLEGVVKEWTQFKVVHKKPIKKENDLKIVTSLNMIDPSLSADFILQLDEDPYAPGVLMSSGTPGNVMYSILTASISAKKKTTNGIEICNKLLPQSPDLGLKLAQVETEFGGDVQMPEKINEYILDENLRRQALGFLVARIKQKQNLDGVDYEKIKPLFNEKLPTNVLRQLLTVFSELGRSEIGNQFIIQKDALAKSFAFHTAEMNEINSKAALACATDEREAICTRAAAVEFLVEYYSNHEVPEMILTMLFNNQSGENPLTFYLLRLLSIKAVRDSIPVYEDFVINYLNEKTSEIFCKAAIYSLEGFDIHKKEIFAAMEDLINLDEYTEPILYVLPTLSDETLGNFGPQMLFYVTDTFSAENIDIDLVLVCINRLLLLNIKFPVESMENILSMYKKFIDKQFVSYKLHHVMNQIFLQSDEAKSYALSHGFLDLILTEIKYVKDPTFCDIAYTTLSQFVYNYKNAQDRILKEWSAETLSELFISEKSTLHFFLCFVKGNEDAQKKFTEPKSSPLLDKLNGFIDTHTKQKEPLLLLELLANVLHSRSVRNKVYTSKNLIIKYYTQVKKYASKSNCKELLDGWLRVFITLTMYPDGIRNLNGDEDAKLSELLLYFITNEAVVKESRKFLILLRNLINDSIWESLKEDIKKQLLPHQIEIFQNLIIKAKDL